MARQPKWNRQASGPSPRRARPLAEWAGWLFVSVLLGCASVAGSDAAEQIDIMILTTDRETTDAVLERLEGAVSLPSGEVDTAALFRGHLTGVRD
jgi:hypothetical protein